MEHWKQFTLEAPHCRNKFQPLQVLHTFLPYWLEANQTNIIHWHILFEPSALIRFQAEVEFASSIMNSARSLAIHCGLDFIPGDTSFDLNPNLTYPGEDYHGEAEFYGDDLWKANYEFMQACGNLSVQIAKLPFSDRDAPGVPNQVFITRKMVHVMLNALGMNYLEEAAFAQHWRERSLELYKTYGRS